MCFKCLTGRLIKLQNDPTNPVFLVLFCLRSRITLNDDEQIDRLLSVATQLYLYRHASTHAGLRRIVRCNQLVPFVSVILALIFRQRSLT